MLKINKKRVAVNSLSNQFVDGEAVHRVKYQNLLEDFLVLQKEFVSKKKKLQIVEKKSEILLAEVRFLRQRHKYFMKMQSDEELVPERVSCIKDFVQRKSTSMQDCVTEKYSSLQFRGEVDGEPLRVEKKQKDRLLENKRVGKKNVSLHDQVTLNV